MKSWCSSIQHKNYFIHLEEEDEEGLQHEHYWHHVYTLQTQSFWRDPCHIDLYILHSANFLMEGMTLTFIRIHKHITRHTDNQFTFHLACTWSQSCSHTTRPARSPVRIQLGMLTIVFTYHLAFFSFFFFFPSLIVLFFTLEMPFTKQLDLVWLMPFCCCRGLVSWIT